HLAAAICIETVTTSPTDELPGPAFLRLHDLLESTYPRVHATLRRQVINQYSLLYTWPGSQPDLEPVLLAAHLDVVPADPATLNQWEHPPFSGAIDGEYIWGRGTQDIKCQVVGLLEAIEDLIKQNFKPERTIYLAFGHDEEISAWQGAPVIARQLEEKGERLFAVLDEGGALTAGMVPGLDLPVAMIGISEKGYATLEFKVKGQPGHSSTPPAQSAITILGAALARLSTQPFPAHLWGVQRMMRPIGSLLPFGLQVALGNLWLFSGTVRKKMEAGPATNAAIRTTMAATVFHAGVKDNILPSEAIARVNFRLFPGDSIAFICEQVRKAIHDERVTFEPVEGNAWEASPTSPDSGPAYELLAQCIRESFGGLPVAPYIVIGATDSRHYASVCDNIYRFTPLVFDADDLKRMHGINERVSIPAFKKMIQFYQVLIRSWTE
ncbi:MAG TPA: M20 family peptidase, partial [Anaerolineaceae bacterium]|nr:M20 family peptidase [Anaerolineaceae bacterium]